MFWWMRGIFEQTYYPFTRTNNVSRSVAESRLPPSAVLLRQR
jgi:hypothetical protein